MPEMNKMPQFLHTLPSASPPSGLKMPNLRRIFVPDPGYLLCDADLAGADAQVVAAEANDEQLLQLFRTEPHLFHDRNASLLGCPRPMAKRWVHGTDYGGSARTMAISCGITVAESERYQRRWFGEHPGIREWHRRIDSQLQTQRFVTNRFGYRRHFFDRIESLLPEALAWIPQSTVAIITNHALVYLDHNPNTTPLLQVHDSTVFQIPIRLRALLPEILLAMNTPVPYDPPLIIPWDLKTSEKSWGECK